MTDNFTPESRQQDDELAEFTDQVLSEDMPESLDAVTQDQELLELQRIVVHMRQAFGADQPDEAMAERIRTNLVREWNRLGPGPGVRMDTVSPLDRLSRGLSIRRLTRGQAYAFSLLVMMVVVGVLVVLLSPDTSTGPTLPGAAQGESGLLPVVLVLGIALAGVLWWLIRRGRSR